MRIILHRGKASSIVDIKKMFVDYIIAAAIIFKVDISKSQIFFDALSGMSALFSYTGISPMISKKILEYAKKSVQNQPAAVSLHIYKFMESVHDCTEGNWYREFDESAIDYAIKIGDLNTASVHLIYSYNMRSATGDFEVCERIIEKFRDIIENFDHDHAILCFHITRTKHLIQKRKLMRALESADDGLEFAEKVGVDYQKLNLLGMKLRTQVLLNELSGAKMTMESFEIVLRNQYRVPPVYLDHFLTAKFLLDLASLENLRDPSEKNDLSDLMKAALINAKRAMQNSKKIAERRTEIYRLKGNYHWLIKKEKKALQWWSQSINEGTRLGARPELARTYMEVGKRLSEFEGQHKGLNGISANEYLNKARSMFKEMDLQWDLDELAKLN